MRKRLVALDGVRHDIVAGQLLVSLDEAPAALGEVPVDDGEGDNVLEALELAGDEGAVRPRARVADVEVVATLLGRVLGAGLARDPVAERADLALELARLVAGRDPIGDFGSGAGLWQNRVSGGRVAQEGRRRRGSTNSPF